MRTRAPFTARALALALLLTGCAPMPDAEARSTAAPAGDVRDTYVCKLPDLQNLVNQVDNSVADFERSCAVCPGPSDGTTGVCGPAAKPPWCTEPYCTKSPYCKGTWEETGRRLLMNLAYDLTGQFEKIDYSGIGELDGATVRKPPDHPRCDIIVSLGDMVDLAESKTATSADQPAQGRRQVEQNLEFWRIIDAAGIPYLWLQGNHDPDPIVRSLATALGTAKKPFFHSMAPGGLGHAIKTATPTPFCVIGLPWNRTPQTLPWLLATVGCGADLPTIVAHHGAIWSDGRLMNADIYAALTTAGMGEIIEVTGGHWTGGPSSYKGTMTATFGADPDAVVFKAFSNFQETNRHNPGWGTLPYGTTPSDGAGTYYTIDRFSPGEGRIRSWDYSPYWQTRRPQRDGSMNVSEIDLEVDFASRFGPRPP